MAKTTIFHITYYDYDKSVYIQFLTCNFSCLGCIRRGYLWDHHYGNEGSLLGKSRVELLEVEKLGEILKIVERELGLQRAVLGGGEPTADPLFCKVVEMLSGMNLETVVLTNGYLLDKVVSCIPKGSIVEVSVKSIHPQKFAMYTGRSADDLYRVLRNLMLVTSKGLRLITETILIPGFNNASDIELLAKYIAEHVNVDTPLIIDEYVPVPETSWRRPTIEELNEARQRAEKHLKNVIVRSSYTMKPKGNVYLVFPKQIT